MKRLLQWTALLALVAVFVSCGGDDSDDVAAFCALAAEASANALEELTPEEERQGLEELRDAAPDEIKEDIDIIVDASLEALENGDESVPSNEEYQAAGARLGEWGQENCPQAEG